MFQGVLSPPRSHFDSKVSSFVVSSSSYHTKTKTGTLYCMLHAYSSSPSVASESPAVGISICTNGSSSATAR
jgi:hypothetical protein